MAAAKTKAPVETPGVASDKKKALETALAQIAAIINEEK